MKNEFVNIVLNKLKNLVPLDFEWNYIGTEIPKNGVGKNLIPDGKLNLKAQGQTFIFWIEVKNQLRNIHLPTILDLKKEFKDLLILAEIIYPNLREKLKKEEINYMDLAGNVFLRLGNNIIYVDGKKDMEVKKKPATERAFNKTGLILLFHFLHNEDFINLPYREIATTYDIAIGNVTYILKNLEELGYARKIENRNFKLLNKEDLLQKWIQYYPQKLKPNLLLGNFIPFTIKIRNWKNLNLEPETLWGAEPAANLLTEYLVPAELTIYTQEPRARLIKNLKLIPEPNGFLKAYRKFWKFNDDNVKTVPPILIYADLLNTGDPRNIETAQIIYGKYIKEKL